MYADNNKFVPTASWFISVYRASDVFSSGKNRNLEFKHHRIRSLNRQLQCKSVKMQWPQTPPTITLHTKTITPVKNVGRLVCLNTIQKELTENLEHSINQSAIVTVWWCINLLLHADCVVI